MTESWTADREQCNQCLTDIRAFCDELEAAMGDDYFDYTELKNLQGSVALTIQCANTLSAYFLSMLKRRESEGAT